MFSDCRVHDKPYVELKDSDGRPDEVVAKEVFLQLLSLNYIIDEWSSFDSIDKHDRTA